MAVKEKKDTLEVVQPAPALPAPMIYGGSYDRQISDLYGQITNRPGFSYDVDGDALYQQYKDRYTQNAKQSMKDTMGQAAALTGGYGSTYSQGVGQQRYDETMRGLTDMIPQLEQSAYGKYQDAGKALQDQYGMLTNMAATEQNTLTNNYNQLAQLITSSGYVPSAEDLTKSGMSKKQANALRQAWMAANPAAAYKQGALSAADFFKLTGAYPPGYAVAGYGGGGGGGYGSGGGAKPLTADEAKRLVAELQGAGATAAQINQALEAAGQQRGYADGAREAVDQFTWNATRKEREY